MTSSFFSSEDVADVLVPVVRCRQERRATARACVGRGHGTCARVAAHRRDGCARAGRHAAGHDRFCGTRHADRLNGGGAPSIAGSAPTCASCRSVGIPAGRSAASRARRAEGSRRSAHRRRPRQHGGRHANRRVCGASFRKGSGPVNRGHNVVDSTTELPHDRQVVQVTRPGSTTASGRAFRRQTPLEL